MPSYGMVDTFVRKAGEIISCYILTTVATAPPRIFLIELRLCFSTGQINVPADFDTIEKAFSGSKTTEEGIKQGLSRSNKVTLCDSPECRCLSDCCRSQMLLFQ